VGGVFLFLFFFLVPIVFSTYSHQYVPLKFLKFLKLFLKVFPIAPQFYPIWFAQSSNSHSSEENFWGIGIRVVFYNFS
jgi:hypothetical protein